MTADNLEAGILPASTPTRLSTIRPALTILAVCLWTVSAWTFSNAGRLDRYGTPKAVDFAQFYVYGRFVSAGDARAMFDAGQWTSRLHDVWEGAGPRYAPMYPPTVGLLFAPLGYLSFARAAIVWTVASLALMGGGLWLLLRACPRVSADPIGLALLIAGWPALQQLLLVGQVSALWFVAVVAAWQAFRAGRPFVAGLALGVLGLKPSFLPFAAIVVAGAGRWRALAGLAASLAVQAAVVCSLHGPGLWTSYADVLAEVIAHPDRYEPALWQAHGLLNALVLLAGRGWLPLGIYGVVSIALIAVTIRRWRASPAGEADGVPWSLFVLGLLITSPHLYAYDLVIMAAALLPMLEWCLARPRSNHVAVVEGLLAASYVLPLFGPLLASVTHVQLSVVAFLALFVSLARPRQLGFSAVPAQSIDRL